MRAAVVVPAQSRSTLLDGCLEALLAQECLPEQVIVVDDSPEGSLALPDHPLLRLERSGGRGPYVARNVGWRTSTADVVLFCDVRSRPRPTWTRELVAHFTDPTVSFAGCDVRVIPGPSPAAEAAKRRELFDVRDYTTQTFFRPYFATCSLAVRRTALETVGGFRECRSGADADLCWRVLDAVPSRYAVSAEVLVDWVPRQRSRDYLEQAYRYGRSNFALRLKWADRGAVLETPRAPHRIGLRVGWRAIALLTAHLTRRKVEMVDATDAAAGAAFELGYAIAHWQARMARRRGRPYQAFPG
jgi:GT2 family glycosyltransferase